MTFLDRVIAAVSPVAGLRRAQARAALQVMARYEAATAGNRALPGRRIASSADAAAANRGQLAFIARDLVRNTPFAARAQQVIANNVVGDGIIWKVKASSKSSTEQMRRVLKAHLDTTKIDADGRQNLFGLQRLALNTVVDAGEVLIRRRRRFRSDGLPLPFQIQVLEPDYIDTSKSAVLTTGEIREGIEYDSIGRRVAYWLFEQHPGDAVRFSRVSYTSRRVPASEILHIYRQDRPGQMRGVSWFAPVALSLQDMSDHQDAQLMRQKIAACFAAFRITPESDAVGTTDPDVGPAGLSTLSPGRIQNLLPGEDIRFATPPAVDGYDEFTRTVLRSAAAGMGITYEALTGDLSNVNFSSGRMGRMEMDRNVSSWQWLMLIPQMMQPLAEWIMEAFDVALPAGRPRSAEIEWVPPHRVMVDPTREISALRDKVRAGFASRSGVVRELGYDPEDLLDEQKKDADAARASGLSFDSDVAVAVAAPAAAAGRAPVQRNNETEDEEDADGSQ